MNTDEENVLIEKAKRKDHQAFTILYNKYYKLIRYIIYDLIKDDCITEDILSTTFLKAYDKIKTYEKALSFRGWLKTIAVNCAIDYIRADNRGTRKQTNNESTLLNTADESLDPESNLIDNENLQQLRKVFPLLRTRYQQILYLRYFENLSYDQICVRLHTSMNTLKKQLNEAKRKLKDLFQTK